MNDLLDRLFKGSDTGVKYDHRNDHGAQVLDAPVTERMLLVRLLSGELCAYDRDQRASRVRDIVDGVKHNGNGMRHDSDHCLKGGEENVGNNPYDAGPYDSLLAG